MSQTLQWVLLLTLVFVTSHCQHCQKEDELCNLQDKQSGHFIKEKQERIDKINESDIQESKHNDNTDDATSVEDTWPKCVNFNQETFGKENASIFVIEAKGRIGNHLMAYTLVKAFEAKLKIQPYITEETYKYVSMFFEFDHNLSPPIFQKTFCNWQDINAVAYRRGVDQLMAEDQYLHTGHVVNLWPEGYKVDEKKCCPAQELMQYLLDNYLSEARNMLKFLPKYVEEANKTLHSIAQKLGKPFDDVTFIGIHNRRTDYIEYLEQMFGMKPKKKSYFYKGMEHFREDLEDEDTSLAFLYVSDDMDWGRKNIKHKGYNDLFFVGKGDSEDKDAIGYDFALLSSCNSTIISHGSFSTWVALLSGGEYYGEYGPSVLPDQQNQKRKRKKKKEKLN